MKYTRPMLTALGFPNENACCSSQNLYVAGQDTGITSDCQSNGGQLSCIGLIQTGYGCDGTVI